MRNWSKFSFFVVALLWGTSFAFQKTLLAVINPLTFIFWNFTLALLVLLSVALVKKTNLTYRLREGVFLGILLSALEIFQMIGLKLSTSADTVFISNLGMLLIPYTGWLLFRHKISVKNNIALTLAVVGMYLLVGGVSGFTSGNGMLLISAVAMALYFLYSQKFESERSSHILALLVQQFFVIVTVTGLSVVFIGEQFSIPSQVMTSFLWQAVLFTVLPFVLIQWASHWADEMIAAVYDGVVEPLVGGIVSWVFFVEPTTRTSVLGALLMVTAFVFASIFSNKHFLNKGRKILGVFVR